MSKAQGVGIAIGGDSDDEVGLIKHSNTVEISVNMDEEEAKQKDVGLDYDPPRERDINVVNEELLSIMEKELNIQYSQPIQQEESKVEEQKVDTWKFSKSKEPLKEKQNAQFEMYYKQIGILDPSEWDAFYATLKKPLDICFRINSVDKDTEKIRAEIESYIAKISKIEEVKNKVPIPLKWYPNGLAYSFDELSRAELRKNPLLKDLHQFLIQETENGRIFRQEEVSMIPVTLLNIEPHHSVIDMCAAPGSKTIQILEYLHANKEQIPQGFVIANDTDVKRAYLLTHQAIRLASPALLVTSNDARQFPNLKIDKNNNNMKFDRILCDVPCSGDGTLRKNLTLWKNFSTGLGHGCHSLQLDILERAFKMLKKGGRLVYSTCSFNPIENEAVVAAALARHIKQMELVDISQEVSPHLKYRQGMTAWKVYKKGKGKKYPPQWYTRFDEVPKQEKGTIKETMFTNTYTMFNNEEGRPEGLRADPLNLKRCMRIFPQDQNTGGFFVAVFTKIFDEQEGYIYDDMYQMNAWDDPRIKQKPILDDLKDFVEEYETMLKVHEEKTNVPQNQSEQNQFRSMVDKEIEEREKDKIASGVEYGKMQEKITEHNEDKEKDFPYVKLLDYKPEILQNLMDFYGINDKFSQNLLYFQKDTNKKIVLLDHGLDKIMGYKRKYKMNIVYIGVKLFSRNREDKSEGRYRINQDGLELLLPYMNDKRKVNVTKELFLKLLDIHSLTFDELKNEWKNGDFQQKGLGSAIMVHNNFCACVWIGVNNVSVMISKEEIRSFKLFMN